MTQSYQMYIAGAFCDAGDGQRFNSVNPATEEVWASFPEATAEDVDRAVKAAHRAFTDGPWSRTSARERGRVLKRIARELEKAGSELSVAETADTGGVFSRDFGKAHRTARAIPAGRFRINTYRVTSYAMPFGGSGNSEYGREGGIEAIHDYTQTKAIFADLSGAPVADPFVMR